jgi:hypothetical protein
MPNSLAPDNECSAAQALAEFLRSIVPSTNEFERKGYGHMGATLTDSVLQAGLNYRSVVMPRVEHVLATYPDAITTTIFWDTLCEVGAGALLRWSHPEKIDRLTRLVTLLRSRGVETETDLGDWLGAASASAELLQLKGIGPKTVDYIKILVGIPTVAVDRHVKTFFLLAGIQLTEYEDFRTVACKAAKLLSIQAHILDAIIWRYVTAQSRLRVSPCESSV